MVKDEIISDYFNIIQNAINRMAQNSFLIKGWYATIFAALIVITYTYTERVMIYPILLIALIFFWGLDSYYLRLERLFRKLYKKVVKEYNDEKRKGEIKLFDMDIEQFKKEERSVPRIMFSISEFYYITFLIILISLFIYEILKFFF